MKMTRIRLLLSVLACAVAVSGCCTASPTIGSQSVVLRPQETNNWCWASTTQMITSFLGHGRNQCDLANARFGRTDCCNDEPSDSSCRKTNACNTPGWTMFAESNFDATATAAPLAWDDLRKQIDCRKKPVSYAYGPKSGGVGHVVVINGYFEVAGVRYVSIVDPWAPCSGATRVITYDEYSNSGSTNHWETNYDITWKG